MLNKEIDTTKSAIMAIADCIACDVKVQQYHVSEKKCDIKFKKADSEEMYPNFWLYDPSSHSCGFLLIEYCRSNATKYWSAMSNAVYGIANTFNILVKEELK
uniref:Uncharacterized protein n=1 Tax=Panagrolaimus davidi TaxID=227884 RepID=A0A914PDN5_9BILA